MLLQWEGETYTGARPAEPGERRRVSADPSVFCTPGLFDVQINGYWGRSFKDIDRGPEGIRDLCWSLALSGSTRFLPTVTTDAPETMRTAMAHIDEACRRLDTLHRKYPPQGAAHRLKSRRRRHGLGTRTPQPRGEGAPQDGVAE